VERYTVSNVHRAQHEISDVAEVLALPEEVQVRERVDEERGPGNPVVRAYPAESEERDEPAKEHPAHPEIHVHPKKRRERARVNQRVESAGAVQDDHA
jgi:hypothetical protein